RRPPVVRSHAARGRPVLGDPRPAHARAGDLGPAARGRRAARRRLRRAGRDREPRRLQAPARVIPLATTVLGSYPQPDWLIDRVRLRGSLPPRVRASELWRVPSEFLAAAQDDATALAIFEMERAGIDIVTDGEIRRESYSNRFATALDGLDID